MRSLFAINDLYYDNDWENAEMKTFYFYHEILAPLQRIIKLLRKNAGITAALSNMPIEYRLSPSEVAMLLSTKFTRCRGLILNSIHCPSQEYDNLKKGILEADADALLKISQDLTYDYMKLEFANRLSMCFPGYSDDVITAVYRIGFETPAPVHYGELPFDEARNVAKRIVVDFWANADNYSTSEIEIVEGIIRSSIFKPFREDCIVLYQRETGMRPQRPMKNHLSAPIQAAANAFSNDVIVGVRGLKEYLGCGIAKAQEILNSGILQKAGISFRVGNRHSISREKLDDYIKNNPNAFARLSKKAVK